MLSQQTRNIIKATIPILEQQGPTITSIFYKNMLDAHEELRNVFNRINQAKGAQPAALATTVIAAAKHIDDLSALAPYVNLIAHKHRALQIKPEQYPIVGYYLLRAIKQVLGNAATPEILSAWEQVYGVIAEVFITAEAQLYKDASWPGWKPFKVVNQEYIAADIMEFTVSPEAEAGIDISKVPIVAGQYITVNVHPTNQHNQYDALRHYSICSESKEQGIKFAVKLETSHDHADGLVSEYLHHHVAIGDRISISAPAGDFRLDEKLTKQNEIPLVFISSGVGATPLMAMLERQIQENSNRPIIWIQSSHEESTQAFRKQLGVVSEKCHNFQKLVVHTSVQPRMGLPFLQKHVPPQSDIYVCGSMSFMTSILDYLETLHQENIHYELFGPKMAIVKA